MNEIQIFNHEEFGEIRAIEIDGEVYFIGSEIAKALGYKNPSKALKDNVDKKDVTSGYPLLTNGGIQRVNIINESGFYSLVLASKLPGAKKFKHWVTSEVLPSIRKTGAYNPNPQRLPYNPYIHIQHVENFINNGGVITMNTPQEKNNNRRKTGERTHIYRNPDGSIFGKKIVNKFSDGNKNAIWYLFNPETNSFNAKPGLSEKKAPLYNADTLYRNQDNTECPIMIVEGEKDVETLANMEIIATSLPNGGQSRQWHDDLYNIGLQGHDIIILTDNDKTGETYGQTVAKNVSRIAKYVKIIPAKSVWSDCPEKGDISDIVQAIGQDKTLELLLNAIGQSECYVDISNYEELIKDTSEAFQKKPLEYQFVKASEVQDKPISFLWYPYLPIGEISLIYARGGTGKTFLICGIAADVSAGEALPIYEGNAQKPKAANVLIISAEDSQSMLKQRIAYAGGNLDNCYFVAPPDDEKSLQNYQPFELPADKNDSDKIQAFKNLVRNTYAKLLIIDPWAAYVGQNVDMNRANDVRAVTSVLSVLAKELQIAIVIVAHVNKKAQLDSAADAVSGSADLVNGSRSCLEVRSFGANSDRRVIIHTKCNHSEKGKSVCYRIVSQGKGKTAQFLWDGFSDLTEDDLIKVARTGKPLSAICNDLQDDAENRQVAIEIIKELAQKSQQISISYPEFRKHIVEETGENFLPDKPAKFLNSLAPDLRTYGIRIETGKKVRTSDEKISRGFLISCIAD